MKKIHALTVMALVMGAGFTSCNKDKTDDDLIVYVDAYSIAKMIDGTPRTAYGFYAQATGRLDAVKAYPPGDSTPIELKSFENSSQTYSYEPVREDFLSEPTASGSFLFEITHAGGELIQETDNLQPVQLTIPEITETDFNTSTLVLSVQWSADTRSDALVLMLLNEQEQAIYSTPLLSPTVTQINVQSGDPNWTAPARLGDVLTVRVQSVVFEEGLGISSNFPNFNTVAIGEKVIV